MNDRNEASAVDWSVLLALLATPFPEDVIEWRAGSVSKDRKRAQALPYASPRAYEDRLNDLCEGAWQLSFTPWGDTRLICTLSIHHVSRASTGEESEGGLAPGTSAEAQAFKRACSKFGLGRYLYDVPINWVAFDAEKKRLAETPKLPKRFLPAPTTKQSAPPTPTPPTLTTTTADTLSPDRARAMVKELEKLGFKRPQQLELAAVVLGNPIKDFASLTETQALEVWTEAKRSTARTAA